MGRTPCCEKVGLKRGPWAAEEDKKLVTFINTHGISCWRAVPKLAGLLRCGKSCRLRWTNYLRPDLKRGIFTEAEENAILELHATLGNRWSRIAVHLPGRTDNEIKNYWNTRLKKRLRNMGLDPNTHKPVGASRTGIDTETVDPKENFSVTVPSSHNSQNTLKNSSPPSESQASLEVGGQLTTFEGDSVRNAPLVDTTPKSEPMNPKQSGLQSSSSDVYVNVKLEQTLSPNHLEYYHNPCLNYSTSQDGPKFEVEPDPYIYDHLHPHARHLNQEGNSRAHEHKLVPEAVGSNLSWLSDQEFAASTSTSLLQQTSGFALSDMAVGNYWSTFWGDVHGQSVSCSGSASSWNDFRSSLQLPGISQEPELQKLAAILDQI